MLWLVLWGASAGATSGPTQCPPSDATVCADGSCDYPNLTVLIGDSPSGLVCEFDLDEGTYPGPVLVGGNRRIVLNGAGTGAVTLVSTTTGVGLVQVSGGSSLALSDMTVSGFQQRALHVAEGSTLELTDVVVTSLGAIGEGGGLRVVGGSDVSITDAQFLGNAATQLGGAVLVEGSSIDIHGTQFLGGFAATGAALAVRAGPAGGPASATVTDGTFLENIAGSGGGAIFVDRGAELHVSSSRFERNFAASGGAIATAEPSTALTVPPTVTIDDSVFLGNEAFELGGAIAVRSGSLTLEASDLLDNRADEGGAVYLAAADSAVLTSALMCDNAASTGGALHVAEGPAPYAWRNLRLLDNEATLEGGALYLGEGAQLELAHSNLLGNVAGTGGGAVRTRGSLTLDSALVAYSTGRAVEGPLVGTTLRWSVFWSNPDGHLPFEQAGEGVVFDEDPVLRGYVPGGPCGTTADLPGYHGALRGAGNPVEPNPVDTLSLPDGSLLVVSEGDAGAYGGPGGDLGGVWSTDADGDGVPLVYDCDDTDAAISPLVEEIYYDGVDGNCDGLDDADADGDGVPVDLDCDDADPEVFPGAPEPLGAGRDMDCDGLEDHDGDGFAPPEDCNDDDRGVNPGVAEDANPIRDANCDGVADVVRPLVPRSCAVSGRGAAGLGWVVVGLLVLARRRTP